MLIPDYWAETSLKHKVGGKQITVRRFGWSEQSQEDAQRNAEARAEEAFARVVAGEKLERREPKVAYNGAVGVPIREEVLSRHDETIDRISGLTIDCNKQPQRAHTNHSASGRRHIGHESRLERHRHRRE